MSNARKTLRNLLVLDGTLILVNMLLFVVAIYKVITSEENGMTIFYAVLAGLFFWLCQQAATRFGGNLWDYQNSKGR